MKVFLNPVLVQTSFTDYLVVFLGWILLIAAVLFLINFILKSANKRYEEKIKREAENRNEN